ncbi:MAG TPA: alpha/beta hydrolase [Dermatophilaceae bacterium]|nr:alpha/beta hydrolase [Dermatophilaceae bacterium]
MSEPALLLLHGLGANAHVWDGLIRLLRQRDPERVVVAPDLPGHAGGPRLAHYSFGEVAAAVAEPLDRSLRYAVLGHSFGGVVALTLATGWFGLDITEVTAVGVKVAWSEQDGARAAALAVKPHAWFETHAAAAERFAKVAGLWDVVPTDHPAIGAGVEPVDGGWRTTVDPATTGGGAPDMVGLLAAARAPVRLARGELDPMCTAEDLVELAAQTGMPPHLTLAGVGHNPHVEAPEAVLELVRSGE